MSNRKDDLATKGYTDSEVFVFCSVCGRRALCTYTRNWDRGGQPRIQLPDDWKVIIDVGKRSHDPVCPKCHPREVGGLFGL